MDQIWFLEMLSQQQELAAIFKARQKQRKFEKGRAEKARVKARLLDSKNNLDLYK